MGDDEADIQDVAEGVNPKPKKPKRPEGQNEVPKWYPIAGFIILGVGILYFLTLATVSIRVAIPPITLKLLTAALGLIASGAVFFLGGTATAKGHIKIPFIKSPMAVGLSGGAAAFVIVWVVGYYLWIKNAEPPSEGTKSSEVAQDIASMVQNLDKDRLSDAEIRADDVLKVAPTNQAALNGKGTIAFYRREYPEAINFFKAALNSAPNDPVYLRNLADSYVEHGDYQEAIRDYLRLNDTANVEWKYMLARAYFYADDYQKCLDYVKEIPTEAPRLQGDARILQAAALAGLLEMRPAIEKEAIQSEIKKNLTEGRASDKDYWDGIFSGKQNEHISYVKVTTLVGKTYDEIRAGK